MRRLRLCLPRAERIVRHVSRPTCGRRRFLADRLEGLRMPTEVGSYGVGGIARISRYSRGVLDTLLSYVRPLELHVVAGDVLKAPRANIADFPIMIVIPACTRYGV